MVRMGRSPLERSEGTKNGSRERTTHSRIVASHLSLALLVERRNWHRGSWCAVRGSSRLNRTSTPPVAGLQRAGPSASLDKSVRYEVGERYQSSPSVNKA